MTTVARWAASIVLVLAGTVAFADVVVLKGGAVINLKKAPEVRGATVLLTRTDGTVLSVRASDIDRPATAAARSVAAAPPGPATTPAPAATLAGAARAAREVPKARVKISDADVTHHEAAALASGEAAGEAAPAVDASAGAGRVEVADYTQEKSGEALVVRGSLKNPGATPAGGVRMSVTAIDTKGQAIASADAGLASATIDPAKTVAFSVTIPVAGKAVGSIRFTPRWVSAAPAPSASGPEGESGARAAAAGSAPAAAVSPAPAARPTAAPGPAPTPYGRGTLYAPPAANAPSQAPADGKSGYIPGASNPANQPKPPG
ncbi:MAG TPA: hypothetical protein VIY96_02040 [Thermoanaerobaculia bacterium]